MNRALLVIPAVAVVAAIAGCGAAKSPTKPQAASTYQAPPAASPAASYSPPPPPPGTTCADITPTFQPVVNDMNTQDSQSAPLVADGLPLAPLEGLNAAAWVSTAGAFTADLDAFMAATQAVLPPTNPPQLASDIPALRTAAGTMQSVTSDSTSGQVEADLEADYPPFQAAVSALANDCGLTISPDWSAG